MSKRNLLLIPAIVCSVNAQTPAQQTDDKWFTVGTTTTNDVVQVLIDIKYTFKCREGWWTVMWRKKHPDNSITTFWGHVDYRDNTYRIISASKISAAGIQIDGMPQSLNRTWEKYFPGSMMFSIGETIEVLEKEIKKEIQRKANEPASRTL